MTALQLIDNIFSRPQSGVANDIRRITCDQVKYLWDLLEKAVAGCPDKAGRARLGRLVTPGPLIPVLENIRLDGAEQTAIKT